ncbi:MAG TPA: flavin reductase family protein [candidate division Zixibacteria bacterium]
MSKILLEPQTILFPLPAVMVSCRKKDEKPNIITLAWVGVVCSEPPMVGISIRKNRFSHGIVKESKEFVINVPTQKLIKATDFCGTKSGKNVDKFAETKLTSIKGEKVNAPLIKECPVNLECVVKQILELGSHDLFLGEIVATHVDSEFLDSSGKLDVGKMELFCYCPKAHEYRGVSEALGKYGAI